MRTPHAAAEAPRPTGRFSSIYICPFYAASAPTERGVRLLVSLSATAMASHMRVAYETHSPHMPPGHHILQPGQTPRVEANLIWDVEVQISTLA
jgi:hypothetical protein